MVEEVEVDGKSCLMNKLKQELGDLLTQGTRGCTVLQRVIEDEQDHGKCDDPYEYVSLFAHATIIPKNCPAWYNERMSNRIVRICKILFGTFLLALSVEMFIIPYNILSGGVAGIAVALEPFFHYDETLFANILTVGFMVMGWLVLGKQFVMDSVLASLCYPVFTTLCSGLMYVTDVPLEVASIYAGLLGGAGIGIVMSTGASTGGVDIPTMILSKLFHIRLSTMVLIVDGFTVLLGVIAYDISAALIGLLSVFVSSFAVGKVLSIGQGEAKRVEIISVSWEKINTRIQDELGRGVTLIDAQGGYKQDGKKMILAVVTNRQYPHLLDIIHEEDANAFVITTDASDMRGEGFADLGASRM